MNRLVDSANNAESIMINPTSQAIKDLSSSYAETKDSEDENKQGRGRGSSPASIQNDLSSLADVTADSTTPSISMDTSCPGNICDRFDTVAPTSDEASQKTLVQFTIRVNNK